MIVPKIVFVYDRKKRADKRHKGSIELRITLGSRQKFMSTGISVLPHQWKGGNPYVAGYATSGEDNAMLAAIYKKAARIVSEQIERDSLDIDAIPTLLKAQTADMTFLDYVLMRMEKKNVVEYTQKSYISFYNKLSEYGKIKFFSDITEKAIRDFDEWLHAYKWAEKDSYNRDVVKHYSQATIGSYHKNLKNFIADAVVDGYLKENVYVAKGIKVSKGEARIDKYLTPEELRRIEDAEMPTRAVSESRDLFVFACHTGLSFVDLMEFDPSRISEEGDMHIYSGIRHKTGIKFVTPVTKKAMEILEKYDYHLPKLPNQKYNVRLKLVADSAGIEKGISSHFSRHTAASVWLNEGIPIEIISKALGHSNTVLTERVYSKMFDKTIAEAFAKVKKSEK